MGVQAAMIIHAAGASAQLPDAESTGPPTHAVALTAAPAELARLARTLAIAGLPLVLIHEPDPPWPSVSLDDQAAEAYDETDEGEMPDG